MSDSEKGIWNGGNTFTKLIRESEDYYDTIDSELEDREDIKNNKKRIRKPYHELYKTNKEK